MLVRAVLALGVLLGKGRAPCLRTFNLFKDQLGNYFVVCTLRS